MLITLDSARQTLNTCGARILPRLWECVVYMSVFNKIRMRMDTMYFTQIVEIIIHTSQLNWLNVQLTRNWRLRFGVRRPTTEHLIRSYRHKYYNIIECTLKLRHGQINDKWRLTGWCDFAYIWLGTETRNKSGLLTIYADIYVRKLIFIQTMAKYFANIRWLHILVYKLYLL